MAAPQGTTEATPALATHGRISPRSALLALLLIAPIQIVGTSVTMVFFPDSTVAKVLFFVAKAVMLVLPIVWMIKIDMQRPRLPRWTWAGMPAACITGTAIFLGIAVAYYTFGRGMIDVAAMREKIAQMNLDHLGLYLLGAFYWCTINSLLEEYFWRWFVFTRCERLMHRYAAVVVSGLLFTAHHVVALSVYFDWQVTALASLGVFIGGATWSWLYLRYRNIYAAYISHVFADVIIFWIGYQIIFNQG